MPNSNELYDKVLELAASDPADFVALAYALSNLHKHDTGLFGQGVGKIGLSDRKARDLVKFGLAFEPLLVGLERLRAIGLPKLVILAPHVNRESIDQLLELAEDRSVKHLRALVKGESPPVRAKGAVRNFDAAGFKAFEEAAREYWALRGRRRLPVKEVAALVSREEAQQYAHVGEYGSTDPKGGSTANLTRLLIRAHGQTQWTSYQRMQLMVEIEQLLIKLLPIAVSDTLHWDGEGQALVGIAVDRANFATPTNGYEAAAQGFLREENPFPPGTRRHADWIKSYERPNWSDVRI